MVFNADSNLEAEMARTPARPRSRDSADGRIPEVEGQLTLGDGACIHVFWCLMMTSMPLRSSIRSWMRKSGNSSNTKRHSKTRISCLHLQLFTVRTYHTMCYAVTSWQACWRSLFSSLQLISPMPRGCATSGKRPRRPRRKRSRIGNISRRCREMKMVQTKTRAG